MWQRLTLYLDSSVAFDDVLSSQRRVSRRERCKNGLSQEQHPYLFVWILHLAPGKTVELMMRNLSHLSFTAGGGLSARILSEVSSS